MISITLITDKEANCKKWIANGNKEDFKCSNCEKEINEGFIQENNSKKIYCDKCFNSTKVYKYQHNERNELSYIKFIKEQ